MLKKVFFFPVLIMGLFFASCDDTVTFDKQQEIDRDIIEQYVADNNLQGFFTDNNVFVSISTEGSGEETPTVTSNVEIIYTGYLLDGTVFDSSDGFPVEFTVWRLIQGWQEGLTYFKRGSVGKLIIPSRFAYKSSGTRDGSIPPNAVIGFDIELINFSN